MRWFWIDRFVEFISGQRCAALKCVALDEEVLDEYLPGFPVLPSSVMIEGLAQCGGILIAESQDFAKRVVLAKVSSAVFYTPAIPGDQLVYRAVLDSVQNDGAVAHGTIHRGEELLAEVQLMFAFLDDSRFGTQMLFAPDDLRCMLQLMRLYEVAVDQDGQPLSVSRNLYGSVVS